MDRKEEIAMRKVLAMALVLMLFLFSTVSAFAAPDQSVVLINPVANSTVYSSNLLISVKVTQPKTIKIRAFEEKQVVNGTLSAVNVNTLTTSSGSINKENLTSVAVMQAATFTCTNNLSFYTKQINDLKPGLYRIQVDTTDQSGKIENTISSYVVVKEKVETDSKILESQQ